MHGTPVLFVLQTPVCVTSSWSLPAMGDGATRHNTGDPTAVGVRWMCRVGLFGVHQQVAFEWERWVHMWVGCLTYALVVQQGVGAESCVRWVFSCAVCVCVCERGVSAVLSFQSASACGAFVVHSKTVLVQGGVALTSGVCARMCVEVCMEMLVQCLHLGLHLLMGGRVCGGCIVHDGVCGSMCVGHT